MLKTDFVIEKRGNLVKTKFVFVTGGVISSIGKGVLASSLGALLEARGFKVSLQKMDPYLNVDSGTMSPFQHGEVFVTHDGAETDLDLGHYERFTSVPLSRKSNFTTGQVYFSVIQKERKGDYLGGTIQVVPHITDAIKERIFSYAQEVDIAIVEVGGTVGDIESLPFLEAIRQIRYELGSDQVVYAHTTYVPYIETAGEIKTKPTQHSVGDLRKIGIHPDLLFCRSHEPLPQEICDKIASSCSLRREEVISVPDMDCIYQIPLHLHSQNLDTLILSKFHLSSPKEPSLQDWERVVHAFRHPTQGEVLIAIVGKYVDIKESYKSLSEALTHAGMALEVRVNVKYVDSEEIENQSAEKLLSEVQAILIPGGFGKRGTEGKIQAISYARHQGIPFFGICLGMQLTVIEYARHVVGLTQATSREFSEEGDFIVDLMESQKDVVKGGTMRLGSYECQLKEGSQASQIYGKLSISERHRHRYEFNNAYRQSLESKGLVFSGICPFHHLVELVELPSHPWFIACQFHPEFQSKPLAPHPLFQSFLQAAKKLKKETLS